MHLRCSTCTRTIEIAATGVLPPACPHCRGPAAPARLGPFLPERLLATGGMGEVYLARHGELGTPVAIKVLPAMPPAALSQVQERFAREARLTAKVQHPGVVRVLDFVVADERPFLVLELLDGQTLRQRLGAGPLPLAEAATIVAAVADVLAAAHAVLVLHRDIKPDNVMVTTDGSVRVLDFGIAKALGDDAPLTRTGELLGTPEYMAPEQLLDGPDGSDARTDVHALGLLLYELTTGRSPLRGSNLFQSLKLVESLLPPPPSSLRPGLPTAVDALVLQALQKVPADRPASAAVFAAELRRLVPAAERLAPAQRRPVRRWPSFAVAALLLVAAIWATRAPGPPAPPGPIAPVPATPDYVALLQAGQWSRLGWSAAATTAELDAARDAFVLHHVAWPLAAGAPTWLGCCDRRQRQRLFGDELEPATPPSVLQQAQQRLLDGDVDAAARLAAPCDGVAAQHVRWLAAALQGQPPAAAGGEFVLALLAAGRAPLALRTEAFAELAARLPFDAPEHWLARTLERGHRGDADGAREAAKLAWLGGAGELAVLLEAAAATNGTPPPADADRRHSGQARQRRLVAADRDDHPASHLLAALLTPGEPELGPLRTFPALVRGHAVRWCLARATADTAARDRLLLLATALGAVPDFVSPPWCDAAAATRSRLEQEASRGH